MAIDYNAGINSIDVGAHDITYSGNQGPKSPDQEREMAFDDTPRFELKPLELLLEEFREDNNGQDPTSIDDLRKFFYNKYGPKGIAKLEQAVQQAEQQAQMQQGEGIQMASAADPMLQEEYDKYVFEMEEQGLTPMSFEEFRKQAVAGMATGGRIGYASGQLVKNNPDGSRPGYYGADYGHMEDPGTDFGKDTYTPTEVDRGGGGEQISDADALRVFQSRPDLKKAAEEANKIKKAAEEVIKQKEFTKQKEKKKEKFSYKKWYDAQTKKAINKSALDMYGRIEQYVDLMDDYGLSAEDIADLVAKDPSYGYDFSELDKGKEYLGSNIGTSMESWRKNPYIVNPNVPIGLIGVLGNKIRPDTKVTAQNTLDAARTYVDMANRGASLKEYTDFRDRFKPPTPGEGGDGPQPIIYPYQIATATGTDTPVDEVDPVTGFPTDRIRFASSEPSVHDFTGIYGQRTIPVKDGGRIGYAGGGIADLRQGYFLGKLVKKITKPLKKAFKTIGKIGKSPLGRMALLGLGAYGLGGAKFLGGQGIFAGGQGLERLTNLQNLPGASFFMGGGKDDMYEGKWNPWKLGIGAASLYPLIAGMGKDDEDDDFTQTDLYKRWLAQKQEWDQTFAPVGDPANFQRIRFAADGGRIGYAGGGNDDEKELPHRTAALKAMYGLRRGAQEGGLMDMGGMEKDYRNEGGFVPIGGQERADDVPARLSKNEFVFTADAVRNAGGGDIDKGAEIMENLMENLEKGGNVSEESQGLEGARNMFATSQRLEGVL